MNKTFISKTFSLKKFCILSLFTAITAILSIYCTLRIGNAIKIPFKFISVFLTAATLGPVCGGIAGALGDILNVFLAPSGAWLPPLTIVEFLYGFVFGVFFYNRKHSGKSYILRTFLCIIVLFLIDMFISTFILKSAGYFPTFMSGFWIRLSAGIIKALVQGGFILMSSKYLQKFKTMMEV